MINILPMHNPRRLAEECAMLDYLTHGRLEIGVGRGVDQKEYMREGIPMEEVRPRFEDGLDLMMKALNQKVFIRNGLRLRCGRSHSSVPLIVLGSARSVPKPCRGAANMVIGWQPPFSRPQM